eukprot:8254510-Karenia_brevis.AAC.1
MLADVEAVFVDFDSSCNRAENLTLLLSIRFLLAASKLITSCILSRRLPCASHHAMASHAATLIPFPELRWPS